MPPPAEDHTESIRMTSLKARLDLGKMLDVRLDQYMYIPQNPHMFIRGRRFCIFR